MAITVTNRGLEVLANSNAGTIDLRIRAFKGTVPSVATIRAWNVRSDITTTEAAASGYTEKDVTGVAATENDTNNQVEWRGDAMVVSTVASGETWTHVAWINYVDGTAANDEVIAIDEPPSSVSTDGGNVTLPAFIANVRQQ